MAEGTTKSNEPQPNQEADPKPESQIDWKAVARRRWRHAWIDGDGPFAVLAHCRELTIELFEDAWEATGRFQQITNAPCGGDCWLDHELRDLRIKGRGGLLYRTPVTLNAPWRRTR